VSIDGEHRGLVCPECGSSRTRTKDSRAVNDRTTIRRRRRCRDCLHRWTTYEYTMPIDINPAQGRPTDWEQLTNEQRRILTRIIHDFARDNQRKENGHDVRPGV